MGGNYVECGYVEDGYFDDNCGVSDDIVKVYGFSQKTVIEIGDSNSDEAQQIKSRKNRKYGRNAFVFSPPKMVVKEI